MIKFLKNLFGMDKPSESNPPQHPLDGATRKATEVPYKIETPPAPVIAPVAEPVKVETAKPVETPKAKAPAKPRAPAKPKDTASKATKPKAPRKPRMTVAK
jgi:hypothetical protein